MNNNVFRSCALLAVLLLTATSLCAQSLDPGAPAPVRSNSVTGRIAARDLGDARLTNHYYAFTGTPGDLLITVQGQNLNGDIDVFTATTLRPLLKLTLYAESSAPVTKGIYLRKREDLVLRVEARTPNDDEGTYRLFFGGSFEPIIGGPDIAEGEQPTPPKEETAVAGRKTKRVSSVGATIPEPEPSPGEVAAAPAPTPEPTPEAPGERPREPRPVESPTPETERPTTTEDVRPSPPRTGRARRPPGRRTTPPVTERATESPRPSVEQPRPEPEAEIGPRLLIETSDGTLINRAMSGIKRVTVENGQVVVVGRDGKISRFLLADVVRMSISP